MASSVLTLFTILLYLLGTITPVTPQLVPFVQCLLALPLQTVNSGVFVYTDPSNNVLGTISGTLTLQVTPNKREADAPTVTGLTISTPNDNNLPFMVQFNSPRIFILPKLDTQSSVTGSASVNGSPAVQAATISAVGRGQTEYILLIDVGLRVVKKDNLLGAYTFNEVGVPAYSSPSGSPINISTTVCVSGGESHFSDGAAVIQLIYSDTQAPPAGTVNRISAIQGSNSFLFTAIPPISWSAFATGAIAQGCLTFCDETEYNATLSTTTAPVGSGHPYVVYVNMTLIITSSSGA